MLSVISRQKKTVSIGSFHLYEIPRIGKFLEREKGNAKFWVR